MSTNNMNKPYCGAKDLPKGRTLGTMKECEDTHQIRYYGLKKVDKRDIENHKPLSKLRQKASG